MPFRYVPLLRSKAGEAAALANLDVSAKRRILPVIHLSETVPPRFAPVAGAAWSGLSMALDGAFNFDLTGQGANYINLFQALGSLGVNVIPSVTAGSPMAYVNLISPLVGRFGQGLIVKSPLDQLPNLTAWVSGHGWSPPDVDVVIDVGDISGYPPNPFRQFVLQMITSTFPQAAWRSVTLAAAAAPKDHGALPLGRTDVPRLCWLLWRHVHPAVGFHLDYGDYATGSPDLTEPPGVAMARATVSVRYTTADHWIVLKGRPTGGATGQPMAQQYQQHAQTLMNDPDFGGLPNCWADQRIQQIAQGASPPGNRATWVSIAVNRHLSFVGHNLP